MFNKERQGNNGETETGKVRDAVFQFIICIGHNLNQQVKNIS
jgi:hypothetical protein